MCSCVKDYKIDKYKYFAHDDIIMDQNIGLWNIGCIGKLLCICRCNPKRNPMLNIQALVSSACSNVTLAIIHIITCMCKELSDHQVFENSLNAWSHQNAISHIRTYAYMYPTESSSVHSIQGCGNIEPTDYQTFWPIFTNLVLLLIYI